MTGRLAVTLVVAFGLTGPLSAQPPAQSHPGEYAPADVAYGSRIYDAQCTTCHGANGDGVGGVDLRSGRFRNAVTDQDLMRVVTNGIPGTGMLAFKFDASELAGVIAYLRNMNAFDRGSVKPGNADRGRAILEGRGACLKCHRVGMNGSRVAPDLSDIGAIRSAASIQRSLVEPTSQMMPINRPVRLMTQDGRVVNGRRLNEDTYTVQIIDDQERLLSFTKSELREYTIVTSSPMPSFRNTLRDEELSDLLAYLLSLKGAVTP
ncbi:MAG TPA: c-type cytochrome [Vicinamibacterales bacterium]|jgi:putative heme-binding domain-containing protein